jgi:protein-S-isoprenylcysteine O-methyltransferase Ste14
VLSVAGVMRASMASGDAAGNNAAVNKRYSFGERGGWWVATQVVLLAVIFFLAPWTSRTGGSLARPLQYLGVMSIVLGAAVIAAGFVSLGSSLTPYPRPRGDAVLITHGIYRFMRHPIYTGLILGTLGWTLAWISVPAAVGAIGLAVFFDRKAAREERWLNERYPDYAVYAARVRRFVPGVY